MAYDSSNQLNKIIEIQNIVIREQQRGYMNQKEVYYQLMEPVYHISIRTFYNYMGRNAKKELSDKIKQIA